MRVMVAAFLTGALLCMPALATEKPPADTKPATDKTTPVKPESAKPVTRAPVNKPVDYGDMRCAFAVRHRDVLDGQIIAWASGFIEGYAKANPERLSNARVAELTDPTVLRTHIRGYCLKYRERSIEAAALAMIPHAAAHPTEAPAQHQATPSPQHPTAAPTAK